MGVALAANVGSRDDGSMPAVTIDTSGTELTMVVITTVPAPTMEEVSTNLNCGKPATDTYHA